MAREEGPGAGEWVPARPSLKRLREAILDCRGCDLYRDATQPVMGDGPPGASMMVLGEQPGDREDLEGEPFVGPAGRILDRALDEAGLPHETVYRTNVVKHFRFSGTRGKRRIHQSPSRWHVTACGPWLVAELGVVRPTGVVVLGATAGKAVFGSAFRVGQSRGRLLEWPQGTFDVPHPPAWVLPTTHPAAVLRTDEREAAFQALVADLRVAVAALPEEGAPS